MHRSVLSLRCESAAGAGEMLDLYPTKAICVGRNYRAHAEELGNALPTRPLLFMKPTSAIVGPEVAIMRPTELERVDHEGELCIVMAKRCSHLQAHEVADAILGYTCANDITARELQGEQAGGRGPWLRAKGMDSFLPIGPRIVTDLDPSDLGVCVRVNGEERQRGRTSQFVFSIADILMAITREFTLEAHDLVLTGTPAGVGNLAVGDQVEVEIEGIGVLRNPVEAKNVRPVANSM